MKTSQNCPLQIDELRVGPNQGFLGITLCPGKKDPERNWDRNLSDDLQAIASWGASTLVTLIEEHEFAMLQVESLGRDVRKRGIEWIHLPIVDVSVPDQRFKTEWVALGPKLHVRLDMGQRILIHCRGGLGRAGLVAGVLLAERGMDPNNAIEKVRMVRRGAIQTYSQENYIYSTKPSWPQPI